MFDTRADIWRINKNVDFYEKTRTYVLFLLYGKKKLENEGIHFESVVKKLKIKYKENISWWHSMYTAQNRMEWLILIWSLFFFFFFFLTKETFTSSPENFDVLSDFWKFLIWEIRWFSQHFLDWKFRKLPSLFSISSNTLVVYNAQAVANSNYEICKLW